MELTLLTVPACPSAALFEERLAAALAGHPDVVVQHREIADEREAAEDRRRGPLRRAGPAAEPVVPALPGPHRARRRSAAAGRTAGGTGASQRSPLDVRRAAQQIAPVGALPGVS